MDADVIIVGAGAAGLATAVFARRAAPERSVLVLDGAKRIGAKILVSGGSRCNVTNRVVTEEDFWGGRRTIVRRVLRTFPADATVRFFNEAGLTLREEADGKLFPESNRSRDVLDVLTHAVESAGAEIRTGHRVLGVEHRNDAFQISTTSGNLSTRQVVLATGGLSLPKSGSDGAGYEFAERLGHSIVPTTPALVPLTSSDSLEVPSGVSHEVQATVRAGGRVVARLRAPILWTHFGVSGPAALNASRHWLRGAIEGQDPRISLSVLPGETFESLDRRWTVAARNSPRRAVATLFGGMLPGSVAAALLERLGIDGSVTLAHFHRDDRRRLANAAIDWPLTITGSRGYNFAEATAGGVSLDEIDPSTMESRKRPGLYLVGEMLDVDGRLGGFNFQWAWSSAFVAGRGLGLRPSATPG